jgi:cytochrome c oxidase subunit 4
LSNHVIPRKVYYAIFAALMVLTAITVGIATVDLGALNTAIAMAVAVTKATLVVLYFMHVRYSSQLTKIFVASGFIWLIILLVLTMSDFWSREWIPSPPGW